MNRDRASWIPAAEASRLLGVSRTTLYAYVSRGRVRSQPLPGSPRERLYARDDVERLRRQADAHRAPGKGAAGALEWGLPVLESAITLIDGQRLYYRGHDVEPLARARTLEDVAALIWTGQMTGALPPAGARSASQRASGPFVVRAQSMLAAAGAADARALDLRPSAVAASGQRILRILTEAATGAVVSEPTADAALARAWSLDARGSEVIRAALVLCADHELNVGSFTARCVASAGSHPYAVVIAGLAALEGPRHGGAGARAASMLSSLVRARSLRAALGERLRRGEPVDGFGHPLYHDGDPRARVLLEMLRERYPRSADLRFINAFVDAAAGVTGEHPNIDFALAAAARVLKLPSGAPFILFAIGRSVGWIGQAMEQYATGQLIRPRAKYVGAPPLKQSAVGSRQSPVSSRQ